MVLIGRTASHRVRTLVDEELGSADSESRRPALGIRIGTDEVAVEGTCSGDLVREQRYLGDIRQVAISNSRRTSFSDVLRSVDALRVPTMSAHGRS